MNKVRMLESDHRFDIRVFLERTFAVVAVFYIALSIALGGALVEGEIVNAELIDLQYVSTKMRLLNPYQAFFELKNDTIIKMNVDRVFVYAYIDRIGDTFRMCEKKSLFGKVVGYGWCW